MSKLSQPEEEFQQELELLRSMIRRNIQQLEQKPILNKQLVFWMESARFLASELKIWRDLDNREEYDQAAERMQSVLHHLKELIDQISTE